MILSELNNRRRALVAEMPINSVAILSSANRNYRSRDVENPYRQDSDFLYMTGISEPDLLNIIYGENGKIFSILFRDNNTEQEKIWIGERLNNSQILENYGFTEIHSYEGCHKKLLDFIKNKETIYIETSLNKELDKFIANQISNSSQNNRLNSLFPKKIAALHSITQKLRLVKSDYEINLINYKIRV